MITLSDIPPRGASPLTPQMGIFLAALATAPWWLVAIGFYQYLGIELVIWILFALGFNLLFGYIGLHSFGHGAYLGVGAYAFGLFQKHLAVSLWGGLVAAVLAAALAGAVAATLLSHRRGIYYALMSIGIGQVFWFSAIKLRRHHRRRGRAARHSAPAARPRRRERRPERQHQALLFLRRHSRLAVLFLWRLVNAPFGRVLQAIRQNETRAPIPRL